MDNLTTPSFSEVTNCNLSFLEINKDWRAFTKDLEELAEQCRNGKKSSKCAQELKGNININEGHNVSAILVSLKRCSK